jgi:hypothetical protein
MGVAVFLLGARVAMTGLLIQSVMTPLPIDLSALMTLPKMSDAQFYEFCRTNPDLRIERNASGEVIVMPPAFSDTGNRNLKISQQVANSPIAGMPFHPNNRRPLPRSCRIL